MGFSLISLCWYVMVDDRDDFGVGFTAIPGGSSWANTTALAYHFYIPPQLTLAGTFKARQADMTRLGVGGLLTEFDIGCDSDLVLMRETMEECDRIGQSWIGWEFKTYDWVCRVVRCCCGDKFCLLISYDMI